MGPPGHAQLNADSIFFIAKYDTFYREIVYIRTSFSKLYPVFLHAFGLYSSEGKRFLNQRVMRKLTSITAPETRKMIL